MAPPKQRTRGQHAFPEGISVGKTGATPFTTTTPAAIKSIKRALVSVNPGSIAATSTGKIAVTITGVKAGDVVIAERPDGLHDDLVYGGCRVTADDTLTLYLYNPSGGAIDDAALDWHFTVLKLV